MTQRFIMDRRTVPASVYCYQPACACVCMYVCMCVHMYVRMYVCMCVCMCVHACACTCVHVGACACRSQWSTSTVLPQALCTEFFILLCFETRTLLSSSPRPSRLDWLVSLPRGPPILASWASVPVFLWILGLALRSSVFV